MASLKFVNPVAETQSRRVSAALRPDTLDGKTVGLFWNGKPGGDDALRSVADVLARHYPSATFRNYTGSVGSSVRLATLDDRTKIAKECDLVVGTTGDCGGCTSWLVTDMISLEDLGCPTIAIVADHFVDDALRTAEALGLSTLPLLVVGSTITNRSPEAIQSLITGVADDLVRHVQQQPPPPAPRPAALADAESVVGEDLLECSERFNDLLVERGWSDGLPLVPPTPARVERMLSTMDLSPNTVIVDGLYPGLGVATLEKIAVNGVMAGCRPQHLPVLVATVRAYEALGFLGKTQAVSTGPNAPMVLVSGPIVDELGFNSGTCVAGPGSPSHVNSVIGRALRLILMNIGHAYPGVLDMDTIGTSNKYSLCLAEHAAASPWVGWRAEHGYGDTTSTVSIALVYPGADLYNITATSPEEMLDTVVSLTSSYTGTASSGRWLFGGRRDPMTKERFREQHVLLLAPDHAVLFAEHGWSKQDLQNYLHAHSRMPVGQMYTNIVRPQGAALRLAHPELDSLLDQPDTLVNIAEEPGCFEVFVTGGQTGRSQFYFGGGEIATVAVTDR